MKKLSIILALFMALFCFSITAFAADESTTETITETTTVAATTEASTNTTTVPTIKGEPARVEITIVLEKLDGTTEEFGPFAYEMASGSTLTAANIRDAAKTRLDEEGKAVIDTEEYVISDVVIAVDDSGKYAFEKLTAEPKATYEFIVCAVEIDDVKNLATTIGEQLAKLDWNGIVAANGTLLTQIINGTKAAIDSLVNAEWPEHSKGDETTTAVEESTSVLEEVATPDTGVSAVAGAAVATLALSTITAVALRKREN